MQSYAAKQGLQWFNQRYELQAELASLQYVFPNKLVLQEIYIPNHRGDTLLAARELRVALTGYNRFQSRLAVHRLSADGLKLYWNSYPGDSLSSFQILVQRFSSGDTSVKRQPFRLSVDYLKLDDSRYYLQKLGCETCFGFRWREIEASLHNFDLDGAAVTADIRQLSLREDAAFVVEKLSSHFRYRDSLLSLQSLKLKTNRSYLEGGLDMHYRHPRNFSNFVDSVRLDLQLAPSYLRAADVQYFAPAYPDFPLTRLSGAVAGPVQDMRFEDLFLSLGEREAEATELSGSFALQRATQPQSLALQAPDLALQSSGVASADLWRLFSASDSLPFDLSTLGDWRWQGDFRGGLYDFSAKGRLTSAEGNLELDLKLAALDSDRPRYKGQVRLDKLRLDQLLPGPDWGQVSANLSLDGEGFDPADMQAKLQAKLSRFDFRGYPYQGLRIDGRLGEGLFDGSLALRDPAVNFDFLGRASFTGDTATFDFEARLDSADLYATRWVSDTVAMLSAQMDIDFRGIDFERWQGQLQLNEVVYDRPQSHYYFDSIRVISDGLQAQKSLAIRSNLLDAQLQGDYTLQGLGQAFRNALAQYRLDVKLDRGAQPFVKENFKISVDFKDSRLLSQLFLPELLIEPGTHLESRFEAEGQELFLDLESRGIRYGAQLFRDLDLHYAQDSGQSRLSFFIARVELGSSLNIDSVSLTNRPRKDYLNYGFSWVIRDSIDSYLSMRGRAQKTDSAAFHISSDSAGFNLGRSFFAIDQGAGLFIDSSGFRLEDLRIIGPKGQLSLQGYISDDPSQVLRLGLEDFDLSFFNYFLRSYRTKLNGQINANMVTAQLLGSPRFLAELLVDSLRMNELYLGDLAFASDFSVLSDSNYLDLSISRRKFTSLQVHGFYQSSVEGAIDLKADFDRFQLAVLNPFAAPVAENLRGQLNGQLSIKGPVANPAVKGALELPRAALTISFLQTDYNLVGEPRIEIDDNAIRLGELRLRDTRYATEGTLSGAVYHQAFRDFMLDLKILGDDLLVLNTESSENDAYYGTAFAKGQITLKGPPSSLVVKANVRTSANTVFNIPIAGATQVQEASFVSFVQPKNEDSLAVQEQLFDLDQGISLDFDIAVDPAAEVNIILNESTGNKLRARGEGQIKLRIDPAMNMELFGTYTAVSGNYRFNIEGLFNKDFSLEPGGTVVWSGDPFAARLDLVAQYQTRANPAVITNEANLGLTPTQVLLYVRGMLTNPEIDFEIKTPRLNSTSQSILANRLSTKAAMNQQVFSLLALNTFTPPDNVVAGGNAGINEWDLIANQAASFLNRFTQGYQLSLNYQPASENEAAGFSNEELEVGVSKDFFDERLTVNSSVEVPLNENRNNVTGDFEIIYKLTEDGRLRAKGFNRPIDNRYNFSFGQQQLYQQGLGLSYRVDFDSYREVNDLWKRLRATRREEKEAQPADAD